MEKIYLVVEHYIFDFCDEVKTTPYKSLESAIIHFHNQIKREKEDSWIATKSNVIEELIEKPEKNYYYYEAYIDGYACEFSSVIYIKESQVLA